jgi:hypothetical protein
VAEDRGGVDDGDVRARAVVTDGLRACHRFSFRPWNGARAPAGVPPCPAGRHAAPGGRSNARPETSPAPCRVLGRS